MTMATKLSPSLADPGADSPVSTPAFREIMGSFPTGVTVITCLDAEGNPVGLTANAVSSVSLAPPQLLICIGRDRYTAKAIQSRGAFAVHFLNSGQQQMAQRFASPQSDKFAGLPIRSGLHGLPLLPDVLACAQCELRSMIDAGDHLVFIGLVLRGEARQGDPLMYFRRNYGSWSGLQRPPEFLSREVAQ